MRKRHKHHPHKSVPTHAQKPAYTYTFPKDETRAMVDLAAHGMTQALEDYKTRPDITKEEIEQHIIQVCKELEKTPNFTNNHATYLKIAKQWYTYGYTTMQTMYQKDEEAYRVERMKFEEHGWDACYQFAHDKIAEELMAGGITWQI